MNDFKHLFSPGSPTQPEAAAAYEGVVIKVPATLTATVKVRLNHFHDINEPEVWEHDCYWMPWVSQKPAVGDHVVVIMSDEEEAWVVGWRPASNFSSPNPVVNVFNNSGTWTKPIGATMIEVICIGGGGGGMNGRRGAAGTVRGGGAGGGGGARTVATFLPADCAAIEDVLVGSGGAGAVGATVDNSGNVAGSNGGITQFGEAPFHLAEAGGGLSPGVPGAGGAGGGAPGGEGGSKGQFPGSRGGSGGLGATGTHAAPGVGGGAGAPGGGGGAGVDAANITEANNSTERAGGSPGHHSGLGGLTGTTFGLPGQYSSTALPGGGGAGGRSGTGVFGAYGGYGALGGGGGGGSASTNGNASGDGGNGGNGLCIVKTYR